jgi:hypothetical protein
MRYVEFDVAHTYLSDQRNHTCRESLVGVSVDHGACDHPTTTFSSAPKWPADQACQGKKQVPGGQFEYILAGGKDAFPSELPLAVARLGDSLVSFVPAELTFSAGRQVAGAVLARYTQVGSAAPPGVVHSFIAGLANEYVMYGATRREYAWTEKGGGCITPRDATCRQTYEAAATLYGPSTVDLFADRAVRLADSLATAHLFPGLDEAPAREYPVGPERARFPRAASVQSGRRHRAGERACKLPDNTYCATWHDDMPLRVGIAGRAWIGARSATCNADACEIDDTGFSFVTRVSTTDAHGAAWSTIFRVPPGYAGFVPASFVIHGRSGDGDLVVVNQGTCDPTSIARCGKFEDAPNGEASPLEMAEKKGVCEACK